MRLIFVRVVVDFEKIGGLGSLVRLYDPNMIITQLLISSGNTFWHFLPEMAVTLAHPKCCSRLAHFFQNFNPSNIFNKNVLIRGHEKNSRCVSTGNIFKHTTFTGNW